MMAMQGLFQWSKICQIDSEMIWFASRWTWRL